METLKDSELVWRFQKFFGVEKVAQVKEGNGEDWVAIDAKEMPKELSEKKEDNKGGGGGGGRLRKRVKSEEAGKVCPDKNNDDDGKDREMVDDEALESSGYSSGEKDGTNVIYYKINNIFWYSLFWIGSQLGDEGFYALFFSFWFWNIDGAVGRRVILIWNLIMYIGQAFKDIIRWQRPSMPPVIKLESKWALEYGMPSTHAMIGISVPASVIIFTMNRYEYPFLLWVAIAISWCTLVCCSRMYMGMHTLADIIGGLLAASALLFFLIPLVDNADEFLLSSPLAPSVTVILSVLAILFYPGSDRWTPARGDTTVVLGSYLGSHLGNWLNFQCGFLVGSPRPPPYPILWPTLAQYGLTIVRVVIGGIVGVATRAIFKPTSYLTVCTILQCDGETLKMQKHDIKNKKKLTVDLVCKLLTYTAIGFNVCFLAPALFRALGCERPAFYTEL